MISAVRVCLQKWKFTLRRSMCRYPNIEGSVGFRLQLQMSERIGWGCFCWENSGMMATIHKQVIWVNLLNWISIVSGPPYLVQVFQAIKQLVPKKQKFKLGTHQKKNMLQNTTWEVQYLSKYRWPPTIFNLTQTFSHAKNVPSGPAKVYNNLGLKTAMEMHWYQFRTSSNPRMKLLELPSCSPPRSFHPVF